MAFIDGGQLKIEGGGGSWGKEAPEVVHKQDPASERRGEPGQSECWREGRTTQLLLPLFPLRVETSALRLLGKEKGALTVGRISWV